MKQWTLLFIIAIHLGGCAGSGSSNWVAPEGIDAKQVKQAAAQGNAEAQNNLGFLYAKGSGVPQDYVQAAKWYEKAAAQGNAESQTRLGVLYDGGKGVPQDYAKARQWYEKAATQGDAIAYLNLGLLYRDGHGVPGDLVRAYMWFSLSTAHFNGNMQKEVAKFRDGVAPYMTPAQLAEAQRLSQQCQAQQSKDC